MKLSLTELPSPLGTILLVGDGDAVRALDFHDYAARMHRLLRLHYGGYELAPGRHGAASRALEAYFAGDMGALDQLTVATGGTPFQRRVWTALRAIPPGETISYGRLAAQTGNPAASRAVGMANGANPVAIAVPCHRVIGAGAALTGYGGGLHRKQWLLDHERRHARPAQAALPLPL